MRDEEDEGIIRGDEWGWNWLLASPRSEVQRLPDEVQRLLGEVEKLSSGCIDFNTSPYSQLPWHTYCVRTTVIRFLDSFTS